MAEKTEDLFLLEAKNIGKSFHSPELLELFSNISLSIKRGESIAITGKSGVGKTTLLHILGSIDLPDKGQIFLNGLELSKKNMATVRNQSIGFVFQTFNLLEDFSVLENVLMPARIARKPISKEHGYELLKQVEMCKRAHYPAKVLSIGEKQRVAIARALCNDPDLILADEPSGNLDSVNAMQIGKLLVNLTKKHHKALILITHDHHFASLCDHIYELQNGSLRKIDPI